LYVEISDKMKKSFLIIKVLFIFLTVFSLTVFAQGPPPPGGPTDPDPSLPFDGGILSVILGGIVIGVKKLISGIQKA
jgi:hypothetical protein